MVGIGKVADDAVRLVGIAELRLLQKTALTGDERRARTALAQHLDGVGRDDGGEPHRVARRALRGRNEHRRDALFGEIRKTRVEKRRELLDLSLFHREWQMHELVLNGIVSEKNNDYEGVRVNIEKIEPLDRRGARRAEGERRIAGELTGKLSGVAHELVKLLHLLAQPGVDRLGLLNGETLPLHELVHVEPVALRRGYTPCTRVRLLQIAERRELGELVADRGAAAPETGDLCDRLGADRLCRADVFIHNSREYFLFSLADLHGGFLALALGTIECWHSLLTSANLPLLYINVKRSAKI